MIKKISRISLAIAAITALPGAAQAASTTATSSASITVVSQCAVTGGNINLGTFMVGKTWADVGAELGMNDAGIKVGTKGTEYLEWGSVTCDKGTPYTLTIKGTSSTLVGGIKLTVGGKLAQFSPVVKKIGDTVQADSAWAGVGGAYAGSGTGAAATGTGVAQKVLGSVHYHTGFSSAVKTDALVVGSYTDTLTYTLTF